MGFLLRSLEIIGGGIFGLFLLGYFFIGSILEYRHCWLGWKDTASDLKGWAIFTTIAIPAFILYSGKYIIIDD